MTIMTTIEYRQRFLELARKVAEAFEVTPLELTGREQDPELCLELHTQPWIVRFFHRINSVAASPDVAVIEIVIGTPVQENALQLYAYLLAKNESGWPTAYAIDEQTGYLVYAFRVSLDATNPAAVAEAIGQALVGFFNWPQEGAVTLPEPRLATSIPLGLQ